MSKFEIIDLDKLVDDAEHQLDNDKPRRAERSLKKILKINKNCVSAHFYLACVYRRTGEYDLALRHALRTLRLSPKERNASLNMGLIYDSMGCDKLAVKYYRRELVDNIGSAATHWNIGQLYYRKRQWLKSSKHLRRCFDMGYAYSVEDTVDMLSTCYYNLHDAKSYMDVIWRYTQIVPDAAWAFANLGHVRFYLKDYKGAILSYLRAYKLGMTGEKLTSKLARTKILYYRQKANRNANTIQSGV